MLDILEAWWSFSIHQTENRELPTRPGITAARYSEEWFLCSKFIMFANRRNDNNRSRKNGSVFRLPPGNRDWPVKQ